MWPLLLCKQKHYTLNITLNKIVASFSFAITPLVLSVEQAMLVGTMSKIIIHIFFDYALIISVSIELSLLFTSSFISLTSSLSFPQLQSIQSTVSQSFLSLSTIPQQSQIYHCFLLHFISFHMEPFYNFILTHAIIQSFIVPVHRSSSCPYWLHSNNTWSSISTWPHPHRSSSYFHFIIPLPLTGRHPPLTVSL